MARVTWCCLLVAVIVTSLPAASYQFELPDVQSFLNYWDGAKSPVETADTSHRTRRNANGDADKRSRTKRAAGDSSIYPHMVETSSLPMFANNTINDRYMPVLGNGYISTSVYSKFIHVNGLFNGAGADSHRAQVPAVIITRVVLPAEIERNTIRKYSFNVEEGVFIESIECPYAYITHRTYIHHKYIRLLVTDIKVRRKDEDGGTFNLKYPALDMSTDILFEEPQPYRNAHWKVSGRTKTAERGASVASVHSFYYQRHSSISVVSDIERHEIMIQSVDIQENDAQMDFDKAREIIRQTDGIDNLFAEHRDTLKAIWAKGKIETFGELLLSKTVLFSQYYILTSMPPQKPNKAPSFKQVYYGISRNSLARGSANMDYRGHIFWDNEMYILPAVLLFHPILAKNILRIRSSAATAAREHAQQNGHQGYQFPWESALTGHDVTPNSCPDCRDTALHVTGAVGWSIRQYFSATRDKAYMVEPEYNGCDMTREIARFWATLAVYNNSIGRYDINNVTGPDDWHPRVNNNAYTNVMASLAIHWARYFACMCGRNERDEVPDEWMAVADFLELPFDNVHRTHHQFQGYDKLPASNQTIKQADTILLTYPVNWNMSRDIMRNDLEMYEQVISPRTPAMTFSFMSVGYKWGDDPSKMDSYFQKSHEDYVMQPFKIWTEYSEQTLADQEKSSVNYLPGAGGFLQSLIYGYAGIRIRPEFLEFHNPTPPPRSDRMLFSSFDYLGTDMTIEIHSDRVKITINEVGDYKLILKRNSTTMIDEPLTIGAMVTIDNPKDGFYILTTDPSACEHPRDFIYMPWGYSPWISNAPHLASSVTLMIGLLSCLVLLLTDK